jgi:hypothetical protein
VFALSFVALAAGSWRKLFGPYVLAALAIPLLFVAAYGLLEDEFQRTRVLPPLPAASAPAGTVTAPAVPVAAPPQRYNEIPLVPRRVEHYADTLESLARDGFRQSAWDVYFNAVRSQITTPAYVLAIIGFSLAGSIMVWKRRWEMAPIVLWMLVVTLLFAIQYPAFSHRSRYPSYVTPVFVIMASFAVVQIARVAAARFSADTRVWVTAAVAAPVIAFLGVAYVTKDDPGLRRNYEANRQLAEYVAANDLLSNGDEMLFLGWPSVPFLLLEDHPEYAARLHAFGWGSLPAQRVTPEYIAAERIRYYAHDHTGGDYFYSAGKMLAHLQQAYELERVQTFCGAGRVTENGADCGPNFVVLYELTPKAP